MGPRRIGIGAAGVLGALALLGTAPGAASAAGCSHLVTSDETFLAGAGPSIWQLSENGLIEDAGLFDGSLGRNDAFDDVGLGSVLGTDYDNPDTDGCKSENGGREIVYPADTASLTDLTMRPKIFVSRRKSFARVLFTVRNTGATETSVIISFENDVGSDDDTKVFRTSSGDTQVTENDRWAITCEDLDGDGCTNTAGEARRDPELLHVFQSRRRSGQLDGVDLEAGAGDYDTDYAGILVGPNEAKSVMYFVQLAKTVGAARRAAKAIDENPGRYGVFEGMSRNERKFTRNF